MADRVTYLFDDENNYTFDSGLITISGGKALLLADPTAVTQYQELFASSAGFTFDSDKVEFVAGKAQQKDQVLGATCGATYTSSIDLNAWSLGSTTGTPTGNAGLFQKFGNKALNLAYNDTRYVDYSATNNADMVQVGCVSTWYKPNYTGTPASERNIIEITKANNDNKNKLELSHNAGGNVTFQAYDATTTIITSGIIAAWAPTKGVWYNFELNFDFTTGATRIFVDGTQLGSTIVSTGTRSNDVGLLRVGSNYVAALSSNAVFDEILVYDAVKHTANFTPATTINDHSDTDLMCAIHYDSTINISYSRDSGTLTGTATGSAAISGGQLDLSFDDLRYMSYPNSGNTSALIDEFCIRIVVEPNYSGSPSSDQYFTHFVGAAADQNLVQITHKTSGQLFFQIFSSAGAAFVSKDTTWNPTAGVAEELEINYKKTLIGGLSTWMLRGGVLIDSSANIDTRTNNIVKFLVGTNRSKNLTANFKINEIVLFDTVQHTTNYSPVSLSETRYVGSKVDLPQFTWPGAYNVLSFDSATSTEANTPKYIVDGKYWDGGAWTSSDNSYAQASVIADVNTNIGSLAFIETKNVSAVFIAQDVQGDVDTFNINLTPEFYTQVNPAIKPLNAQDTQGLEGFLETVSKTGSDDIKYVLEVDSVNTYYNGSAWVTSSGYTQSNTAAEIVANMSTLDLSDGVELRFVAFFHSNAGISTPNLEELSLDINFYSPPDIDPDKCHVSGTVIDPAGNAIPNATVSVTLKKAGVISSKSYLAINSEEIYTANSAGYVDFEVIRSVEYKSNIKYKIVITDPVSGKTYKETVIIPDQSSVDFDNLFTK